MRVIVYALLILFFILPVAAQFKFPTLYKGEVICVSGDCAKGKGRVRIPDMDNQEFEGGLLPDTYNEGKIFTKEGELIYEGHIYNFVAHGIGKKFERRDDGKDHLLQQGRFSLGIFTTGETFNDDGIVMFSGLHDPYGNLLSGARLGFFRGKQAYLSEVSSKTPLGDVFTETSIREGYKPDSRPLYIASYKNDKLHNQVVLYDYENRAVHHAYFKDGKLERNENGSVNEGYILGITDKGDQTSERIASMVVYEDKLDEDGVFKPVILSGHFAFDKGPQKLINTPQGESSMAKFREMYAVLYKPQLDAKGKPIPYVPPKDLWNGVTTAKDVEGALAEIAKYYNEMMEKGKEGVRIVESTYKHNYDAKEKELFALRNEIVNYLDVLIKRYKNIVPASRIRDLEAWKQNAYRSFQLPAYVTLKK